MPDSEYPAMLFEVYETSDTRVDAALYDTLQIRGPQLAGRVIADVLLHCQDGFGWSLEDMRKAFEERLAEDPVRTQPGKRHLAIVKGSQNPNTAT